MPIDILQVAKDTAIAVEKELLLLIPSTVKTAVEAGNTYISDFKDRTETLLSVVLDENDKRDKLAYCIARWGDEKEILKTEVFSFVIIGEGVLQAAINSVQNILIAAVQSVLPTA